MNLTEQIEQLKANPNVGGVKWEVTEYPEADYWGKAMSELIKDIQRMRLQLKSQGQKDLCDAILYHIKTEYPNLQKTLSPETIDVIHRMFEVSTSEFEYKFVEQAQQEFNAVYGGGE